MGKLLIDAEVAEILNCPARRVQSLRLGGHIPYVRGRPALIDEDDVRALIAKGELRVTEVVAEGKRRRHQSLEPAAEVVQRVWFQREWARKDRAAKRAAEAGKAIEADAVPPKAQS